MRRKPTLSLDLPPGAIVVSGDLALMGPPGDLSRPASLALALSDDAQRAERVRRRNHKDTAENIDRP